LERFSSSNFLPPCDRPVRSPEPFRASKKPQSSAHLCPIWGAKFNKGLPNNELGIRNTNMSEATSWGKRFAKNPAAWILSGLLAFSVYSHYRTGAVFTHVCESIASLSEGYIDLESNQKFEPSGIDIDAIMLDVKRQEALLKANTPEG
jgi:hypothetical protein